MSGNDTVYALMVDKVVAMLEQGVVPWRKPWNGPADSPANLVTKRAYQGSNVFYLHALRQVMGYSSPYWLTINQARKMGGNVCSDQFYGKGGPGGALIVFWKFLESKNQTDKRTGKPKVIPMLRYSTVFNADQTEGIEISGTPVDPRAFVPSERAEEIIRGRPEPRAELHDDGGNRAYYRPRTHSIHMPVRESFFHGRTSKDLAEAHYYSTLFHELGHSTGIHLQRFSADKYDPFGSEPYSFEELVAEMIATALVSECALQSEALMENSAAYLAGWVKKLRDERHMLMQAASAAQKAVDFILHRQSRAEAEPEEAEPVKVAA